MHQHWPPHDRVRRDLVRLARESAACDTLDRLAVNLRPIVARVVRTGCGPRSLVGWVREQRKANPVWADPSAVTTELTNLLVQWLLPASDPYKQTIKG